MEKVVASASSDRTASNRHANKPLALSSSLQPTAIPVVVRTRLYIEPAC